MKETTPLIRREDLAAEGTHHHGVPRRRSQHVVGVRNDHDWEDLPSSYAPSLQEFDKEDRRLSRRIGDCYLSLLWRIRDAFAKISLKQDPMQDYEGYYLDNYNDQPWHCSFGTAELNGIWMNRKDQAGTIMSLLVWLLIIYSGVTVTLLAEHNHLPNIVAIIYCTICALALASHAKTMFTDPGAVPQSAVPLLAGQHSNTVTMHTMCSHCQSYKPPISHHCRICNRCISRMDHHCPWMNNCVGAGNMKHFILFLCYTWTGATFALLIFSTNYFFCNSEECNFSTVLVQLVRAMTVICIGSVLFTSSMIMNVQYGVMTGIGTIDRLKKKAQNTLSLSEEEAVPLTSIFGIGRYWTWWFPMDPIYEDYDSIMGFSVPQRLLREQNDLFPATAMNGSHSVASSRGYSQV